jgi:hypothetical protein
MDHIPLSFFPVLLLASGLSGEGRDQEEATSGLNKVVWREENGCF